MSDILIKNMEIPKDSKYVDVRIFRDGTATTSTAEEPFYKKMDVVEVPTPHGRLIEEPKSYDYSGLVHISPYDFVGITKYFAEQVHNQQTVIEAEGT